MMTIEEITARYPVADDGRMIERAYRLTEKAVSGMMRAEGHPFIEHPLTVAEIVTTVLGLDANSVAAVFVHEAARFDQQCTAQCAGFPAEVGKLAQGLNKISQIRAMNTNLQADNYRKLIVSCSDDPRVTLIKLADRLEVLRNLQFIRKSSQDRKIIETELLYIPLAHKLGLYNLKGEMENIVFKYNEPEQYRAISNKLLATQKERDDLFRDFVIPLEGKLDAAGIKYHLKARTKAAFSIWKKMVRQNIPFEQVYDVMAIRFIIEAAPEQEKELCWKVYSLVTEEYTPDTSRLRDWISQPKANGYESLHTTVHNRQGVALEVQIRTERMDFDAEKGAAAHWLYKGNTRDSELDIWLSKVRGRLESAEEVEDEDKDFKFDTIYIFTPNGDLHRMKNGATVLDFAFEVHTQLGLKCTGGRINGRQASIKDRLSTGDVVEIQKNVNQKPSQDWLKFVVSEKARNVIRRKLKEEENRLAALGREILERRSRNWKLEFSDEEINAFLKKSPYRTLTALFAAIGSEQLSVVEIKDSIIRSRERAEAGQVRERRVVEQKQDSQSDVLVIGSNLGGLQYKMSKCCNPIFGDDVFGFVTAKEGIKIHRISCPNAQRLIQNYPYRIQKVRWRIDANTSSFETSLRVYYDGDPVTGNQILTCVAGFHVTVKSVNSKARRGKEADHTDFRLLVPSNKELDSVIHALKKIRGVANVSR